MKSRIIYFNGEYVQAQEAKVSVLSPTAQFGLNVFEGVKAYYSKKLDKKYIFRLDDHIKRLYSSCKLMRIQPTHSLDEIRKIISELIIINKYREDVSFRITFYVYDEGSWSASSPVGLFIAPIESQRKSLSDSISKTATISSYQRISDHNMSPRIKTGANYIAGRYAHLLANELNYDLPIFLNDQSFVSEGAGACIFIIKNGALITPLKDSSILESITRDTIIKIGNELNIDVYESNITRTMLYDADEVFLCGTAAEITPISKIDGFEFSSEITLGLIFKKYFKIVDGIDLIDSKWLREA